MKNDNYLIQIAEPCHEDWNAMLPEAKGKFCNSCSKSVVDFSTKTDVEIHTILTEKKHEKVCGHFRTSQVNRPLNIRIDFNHLPENMSSTKKFTLALLMVFGTLLFSFTDLKGQQIQNIQVENTETVTYMKGKIARVEPKTHEVPEPPDTLVLTIEPLIMGGIRYVEPDTSISREPEPEIIMGDTMLVPEESCHEFQQVEEETTKKTLSEFSQSDSSSALNAEFIIYPNPSHGDFSIRYEVVKRSDVSIQIFDDKGMLVKTIVDTKQQYQAKYEIPVSTNDLPNGTYIVSGIMDKKRYTERVIVER